MRKRLRKKLYKDEFKEIGFEIQCVLKENISEPEFDKFIDDFIDAVEERGLTFGGGGSHKTSWEGIIAKEKRYSCTNESDKEFMLNWVKSRNEIRDCKCGEDIDLWYPEEEEEEEEEEEIDDTI